MSSTTADEIYYKILEIPIDSNLEQIAHAYREQQQKQQFNEYSQHHLKLVDLAYETLIKTKLLDRHKSVQENQVISSQTKQTRTEDRDSDNDSDRSCDVIEEENSYLSNKFDNHHSKLIPEFDSLKKLGKISENPKSRISMITEQQLPLTLEEVLQGGQKKVQIPIKIYYDQSAFQIEQQTLTLDINPGIISGTKLFYPQKGDQFYGQNRQDLVLIIADKPHQNFTRDGVDLIYKVRISDAQIKRGDRIEIPTLDNKGSLQLTLTENLREAQSKSYHNRGLPYAADLKLRGCLVVEFEIVDENKFDKVDFEVLQNQFSEIKIQPKPLEKLPPNDYPLKLTLEEVFHGCEKQVKIYRKITDENGKRRGEFVTLNVIAKPGSIDGTEILIPDQGDRVHGKLQADVAFGVEEATHSIFKRKNRYDIVYTAKVSSDEAIFGTKLKIPTLDGSELEIPITGVITSERVERIEKAGLPILNGNENLRGDLLIKFDINFEPEKQQDAPLQYDLPLTLEEILHGCVKRVKISDSKEVKIQVKPGTKDGEEFIFYRAGKQNSGSIPADIVFIANEKPHPIFRRNGNDIEYTALVTQDEASHGELLLNIPTLDGKIIKHKVGKIENCDQRIGTFGLPISGSINKRGDLVVRFEIVTNDCKDQPIRHNLPITLENVLRGCTKKMKIKRIVLETLNQTEKIEEKIVEIQIQPGTPAGHEYLFSRAGDQNTGQIPADVIFVTTDKPNSKFTRNGADLEYTVKIKNPELENPSEFDIPTLEGDCVKLKIDGPIQLNTIRKIQDRGLPKTIKYPNVRGDLVVKFDLILDSHVHQNVYLPLEHALTGHDYLTKFTRFITQQDRKTLKEDEMFQIRIPPGTRAGTKFYFPLKGHQKVGCEKPGDLSFVARDYPHPLFNRCSNGVDLEHTVKVSDSTKCKTGNEIQIPVLGSVHPMSIVIPETIQPDTVWPFEGIYGLPFRDNILKRGQMIVRFEFIEKKQEKTQNNGLPNELPTHFKRNGINIEYTTWIPLSEAGKMNQIQVPTLDPAKMLTINGPFTRDAIYDYPKMGLPSAEDPNKRGRLIVKVQIGDGGQGSHKK